MAKYDKKLKHYKAYISRLKLFAKAMNIRVTFDDIDEDGLWIPSTRRIRINKDSSQSVKVASLLHELGHSMDDMLTTPYKEAMKVHRAYGSIYTKRFLQSQRSLVLKIERNAWRISLDIASRLHIRLGFWFYEFKRVCLYTYRKL